MFKRAKLLAAGLCVGTLVILAAAVPATAATATKWKLPKSVTSAMLTTDEARSEAVHLPTTRKFISANKNTTHYVGIGVNVHFNYSVWVVRHLALPYSTEEAASKAAKKQLKAHGYKTMTAHYAKVLAKKSGLSWQSDGEPSIGFFYNAKYIVMPEVQTSSVGTDMDYVVLKRSGVKKAGCLN